MVGTQMGEELMFKEVEASHTLGGAGEGGVRREYNKPGVDKETQRSFLPGTTS